MSNCYKILSIDGGGIKGLYSAIILEKFEERFGAAYKHFDLICGTSTGGIIALGLAAGIPASDIVRFYKEDGPVIFPYKKSWSRKLQWFKQILSRSKYSDKHLRAALQRVFADTRIRDCKTTVMIPSVNITTGAPYVFKSDHQPDLSRDGQRLLAEVALSTTAAPTYFPIVELETYQGTEQFVDGGLWANNPALLGIQEFLKYYKDKGYSDYCLLSVATLHEHVKYPNPSKVNKRMPFIIWGDKLISLTIDAQSRAVDNHIKFLQSYVGGNYIRIPSTSLTDAEKKHIQLDLAGERSIQIMNEKALQASEYWFQDTDFVNMFKQIEEEVVYV